MLARPNAPAAISASPAVPSDLTARRRGRPPARARRGGRPCGRPVEPAAELVARRRVAGSPGQDEEGRLERVLRGVPVGQDAEAGAPDHRPVAVDQRRERRLRLGSPRGVASQELGVGELAEPPAPERGRRSLRKDPECRSGMPASRCVARSVRYSYAGDRAAGSAFPPGSGRVPRGTALPARVGLGRPGPRSRLGGPMQKAASGAGFPVWGSNSAAGRRPVLRAGEVAGRVRDLFATQRDVQAAAAAGPPGRPPALHSPISVIGE